jgi:carbon starvation protein
MTTWALLVNLKNFVDAGDWVLAPLDLVIFVLAMWLIVEAVLALRRRVPPVASSGASQEQSESRSGR